MKKTKYTTEFKTALVAKYRQQSTLSASAFSKKEGVNQKTFNNWVLQDTSSRPVEEQEHLARIAELEKELREARMEREVLKKATAFFAKESR